MAWKRHISNSRVTRLEGGDTLDLYPGLSGPKVCALTESTTCSKEASCGVSAVLISIPSPHGMLFCDLSKTSRLLLNFLASETELLALEDATLQCVLKYTSLSSVLKNWSFLYESLSLRLTVKNNLESILYSYSACLDTIPYRVCKTDTCCHPYYLVYKAQMLC